MKQKSWICIVLSFAAQCQSKIILSVLFAIGSVAAGLVPYISVYQIITQFIGGSPVMNIVWKWCLIGLGAYAVRFLCYGISTTLSHVSAYTILENIRLKLAQRLMKAPLGTVLNESVGQLKNVLVDRVETIELPLAHMIPECISNFMLPVAVFIYLMGIDWRMALSVLITVPIACVAYVMMMQGFNKQYADYMESSNYVNGVIVEYVEGIEVIKAFNQSTSSYEKFAKAVDSFKDYTLKWYQSTWKYMNFGNAVLPSTLLGTLPVGMLLYYNGSLTPQDLVMCLILSLGVVGPLMNFTTYLNEMKTIEYAVHDADNLMNIAELTDAKEKVELKNHNIELKDVCFAYEQGGKQVLDHVSLTLPQGLFSALVGPSGGGKSTIARLVARFWDVTEGAITIGGKNIKDIPLSQLADIVSFVTQDNFLFNCSIKENIRLGNPDATDEEVFAAATAACCDEFVFALEKGYDTMAGDAGNRLSGGEKQRISIARMILKNAPIVILDEATAFTDPENEEKIQQSIAALTKGKTLLVIAHRLSTIKNADQIIVLKDGQIHKTGTHQQLLESDKLYLNMWEAHVGAMNWSVGSAEGGISMFKIVKRLIDWMGVYKKRIYIGFVYAFLHGIFSALPIMLAAHCLKLILDDWNGIAELKTETIWFALIAMIVCVLGRFLFAYLRAVTQESVAYESTAEERIRLGDVLKRVSLGFFRQNNLGEISSAVTTDLSFMEMFATNMINTVVNGYITVAVMILCLGVYNPLVGLVSLIGVILSALFLHFLEKQSKKNAPLHQKAQDDMVESSIEYLRGMQLVKAFKQEGVSINGIKQAYHDAKTINIQIEKEYMPGNCMHLFSLKAATIGIAAVSAWLTWTGKMELATMLMMDMFSFTIFGSIESVNNAAHVLQIIDVTLDKLERIKSAKFIDEDGEDKPLLSADVQFESVSFAYDQKPILKNMDFVIPEGSTTAIVGPSGSGKTTICNLIARFYDVNSGVVRVGGRDVKELTCDSLLGNISMVFQKVYLFHDTIENNIRFGNPSAAKEEIEAAAKKARCHDFIMQLPNGYQTVIGEGGSTLSGGEKQRISIARAILKNAPIVILDEATASIDPENEHLIQQAISELTGGKTVIVIAHRLATIEHADQILVVDEGRIVQKGKHNELIAQTGLYQRFINIREQAEGWSIA